MTLTPEQIELRRTGIGSSDIAAIVGLSPYKSPVRVALEKWGEDEPGPETEAQYWGSALEDAVARRYENDHPTRKVSRPRKPIYRRSPKKWDWRICSPDRLIWDCGMAYVLEVKTAASAQQVKRWGTRGDDVPEEYLLQCAWQMEVMRVERCDLAVLLASYHGLEYREFTLKRDLALEARLIEIAEDFWFNYVLVHRTPPPGGTVDAGRALATMFPGPIQPTRPPMGTDNELADDLLVARDARRRAEQDEQRIINEIKASLGDCEGIDGERYTIRWGKTSKGRRFSASFRDEETAYDRVASQGRVREYRPGADDKGVCGRA